jgi:blue copper oxidase
MDRLRFLTLAATTLAIPGLIGRAHANPVAGQSLPIPDILDVTGSADAVLEAIRGTTAFVEGGAARTTGYSQPYLGPVLRMRRGEIARPVLRNRLDIPVTAHWHGVTCPPEVPSL